jgi:hypothetical protein
MFLDGGLRIAGHVGYFIQARVSFIPALGSWLATVAKTIDVERVGEL